MPRSNWLWTGKDGKDAVAAGPLAVFPGGTPPTPRAGLGVSSSSVTPAVAAVASNWSNRSRRSLRACSMNERNRSTKSIRVRYVDWTTDSGSAVRRRGEWSARCRPRRPKLNVRLRAAVEQWPDAIGRSTTVADWTADGGSTPGGGVTSVRELPLLRRILILDRSPERLLELLTLVRGAAAAACFERSVSSVELLISASCSHT